MDETKRLPVRLGLSSHPHLLGRISLAVSSALVSSFLHPVRIPATASTLQTAVFTLRTYYAVSHSTSPVKYVKAKSTAYDRL